MMGKIFDSLTEQEFTRYAAQHSKILVHQSILGDQLTPVQVFKALRQQHKSVTLLESTTKDTINGRYSYLGFSPIDEITIKNQYLSQSVIRSFYKKNRAYTEQPCTGFAGGVVGFLSYQAAIRFQRKHNTQHSSEMPDCVLKAYRDHIVFDHMAGKITLLTRVDVNSDDLSGHFNESINRLSDIEKLINASIKEQPPSLKEGDQLYCTLSDEAYIHAAKQAKEHIKAGDAFQIVLSRRFEMPYQGEPFDLYRVLRHTNPSPYMFYIEQDDYVICGASPEKMITVRNNVVESCPLAGTRPRGEGLDDAVQMQSLLSDEKEVAEHMMLVDLARNDLGRVAKPGTVTVAALKQVKSFSHVMHLSSTVQAELKEGMDCLDALLASFPAGTLSGAPKIRAMQIIDELETHSRDLYGGVIGFVDAQGNMDSCIAIRMAVIKSGMAYVSAGAGITAQSDLQKEADETRQKASAVLSAIRIAQGGLK